MCCKDMWSARRQQRFIGSAHIAAMLAFAIYGLAFGVAHAAERTQNFDDNPNWEARNNRAQEPSPRDVRQDFGYSRSPHAGGRRGEVGGFITPAAEPAYYAARVSAVGSAKPLSFDTPLGASGTFACPDGSFHVLLGFFNSGTTNEWRTANSIVLRLNGRGDKFHAYVEYCTRLWRAGLLSRLIECQPQRANLGRDADRHQDPSEQFHSNSAEKVAGPHFYRSIK
jgi:hypothetical protein